jgi:hypothetical protein
MQTLQLYRNGNEILASDGIMYVDGRLSVSNTILRVKERNKTFATNFPHKVADSFAFYSNRIGGAQSRLFNL